MKAPHKLDPRPEEAWFDRTIDELAELRRRLEADAGLSAATANGLVGAIIAHDFDTIDCSTAARYRKVLRELGTPTTPEHPARRRRTRAVGQRGAAQIRSTAAGTLVGASVALAAVSPPAAILCGVAAPIILDPSGERAEGAGSVVRLADRRHDAAEREGLARAVGF